MFGAVVGAAGGTVALGVFVGTGVAVGLSIGEGDSEATGAIVTTAAGVEASLIKCLITL